MCAKNRNRFRFIDEKVYKRFLLEDPVESQKIKRLLEMSTRTYVPSRLINYKYLQYSTRYGAGANAFRCEIKMAITPQLELQ